MSRVVVAVVALVSAAPNYVIFEVFHEDKGKACGGEEGHVEFGVNEWYRKSRTSRCGAKRVLEYDLPVYDCFLQQRGFHETSAFLHVYWNPELYRGLEFVGFRHYDESSPKKEFLENLRRDRIYVQTARGKVVTPKGKWAHPIQVHHTHYALNWLLNHYNSYFNTSYARYDLETERQSLKMTAIYPTPIFEKLCRWLEVLCSDVYPWASQPPHETQWGSIGTFTERAMTLFNAIESKKHKIHSLGLVHVHWTNVSRVQYDYKLKNPVERFAQNYCARYLGSTRDLPPSAAPVSTFSPTDFRLDVPYVLPDGLDHLGPHVTDTAVLDLRAALPGLDFFWLDPAPPHAAGRACLRVANASTSPYECWMVTDGWKIPTSNESLLDSVRAGDSLTPKKRHLRRDPLLIYHRPQRLSS